MRADRADQGRGAAGKGTSWDSSRRPRTRSPANTREPINGVSLQDYADWAREARARGVNDEAGLIAIAGEHGVSATDARAALDGWVARMGRSMAVGQHFRKFLGY